MASCQSLIPTILNKIRQHQIHIHLTSKSRYRIDLFTWWLEEVSNLGRSNPKHEGQDSLSQRRAPSAMVCWRSCAILCHCSPTQGQGTLFASGTGLTAAELLEIQKCTMWLNTLSVRVMLQKRLHMQEISQSYLKLLVFPSLIPNVLARVARRMWRTCTGRLQEPQRQQDTGDILSVWLLPSRYHHQSKASNVSNAPCERVF